MTVAEKLKFNKKRLKSSFEKWSNGPGRIDYDYEGSLSAYDSLRLEYNSKCYTKFLDWAYSEYHEFSVGDITPDGHIIVSTDTNDPMMVVAVSIFSTGWAYHLNCLKDSHSDLSKPFVGYESEKFRQAIKTDWNDESIEEIIHKIDRILEEHSSDKDVLNRIHRFSVYMGLSDEEKKFYFEYDKVLRTFRVAISNKTFKIDPDYIKEILGYK